MLSIIFVILKLFMLHNYDLFINYWSVLIKLFKTRLGSPRFVNDAKKKLRKTNINCKINTFTIDIITSEGKIILNCYERKRVEIALS